MVSPFLFPKSIFHNRHFCDTPFIRQPKDGKSLWPSGFEVTLQSYGGGERPPGCRFYETPEKQAVTIYPS